MATTRSTGLGILFTLLLAAVPATAQCAQWAPGDGYPGVAGPNASRMPCYVGTLTTWDPDAGGPLWERLVVTGSFSIAGSAFVWDRAVYAPDTGTWGAAPFGAPLQLFGVTAQAILPNGDQVFARGGVVERWDGVAWTPLGSGMNGTIRALAALPNGDVVAGGEFTTAGGVAASRIAVWNGVAWAPLGSGMDGAVRALVVSAGALVVGGSFAIAGGVAASRIAIWDGAAWSALGSGTDDDVNALAVLPSGELAAAGAFFVAGGLVANRVARWDGVAWSPLGLGVDGTVRRLFRPPGGDLIAYGDFDFAGGVGADDLARWDGVAWSALGERAVVPQQVVMLANGDLVAGGGDGYFPGYGSGSDGVALQRWDGSAWRPLGAGFDRIVHALTVLPNGDVVAGGDFTQAGAAPCARVARRSSGGWAPLGAGLDGTVRALATLTNGDVVAGGDFQSAGGAAANRVARWDGVAWSAMCAGADATVRALAALPGGGVVAGGDFTVAGYVSASRIAAFDGYVWSPMGSGMNGAVRALAVLPNGDVVAGGDFTAADGVAASRIARWDGTAWSPLGSGLGGAVRSLAVLPNGDLVAGGSFTQAGGVGAIHVARWNGAAWASMDTPELQIGTGVSALAILPDGDLVLADYDFGFWVPGQPSSRLLRWDGGSWSPLGVPNGQVHALVSVPGGELAVGGAFTAVGSSVSAFFARYASTCPATAVSFGSGCASSGGANLLAATTRPWVDSTFRATGTGLPNPAIVLALTSFAAIPQGALPLASLLSQGMPGCDVLVDPEILQTQITATGTAESALFLPGIPPLVGLTFFHQMIPIELGVDGSFVAITSTNALQLTAGDF